MAQPRFLPPRSMLSSRPSNLRTRPASRSTSFAKDKRFSSGVTASPTSAPSTPSLRKPTSASPRSPSSSPPPASNSWSTMANSATTTISPTSSPPSLPTEITSPSDISSPTPPDFPTTKTSSRHNTPTRPTEKFLISSTPESSNFSSSNPLENFLPAPGGTTPTPDTPPSP